MFLITGQRALQLLSNNEIRGGRHYYEEIVEKNNMAYKSHEKSHPNIKIKNEDGKVDEEDIKNKVKIEASKGTIKMGSKYNAVVHLKKHPIANINDYVKNANKLIANNNASTFTISPDKSQIDIEYFDNQGAKSVVILLEGKIILKTYFILS